MNKVVLITGGSRGIGRATAKLASTEGYNVAVNYREQAEAAESLVAELIARGINAAAVKADMGREDEIVRMFEQTEDRLGPLTHLVCNAGIGTPSRVDSIDAATVKRMFEVNVLGLMLCCREAARRLSTKHGGKGGAIVNISSLAATTGGREGASTYASTKGAVDVFSSGFAREVAAEGIRVNVVRPGMTMTDMTARVRDNPERRAEVEATIPMGRTGQPEEIAAAVLWLLSDHASFVTNTHINAGGGGFNIGPGGLTPR